jgi:thiamine pyrophosphokinase
LFAYPEVKLVLYDDYSKAFLLPKTFKKRYQRGQKISLFPNGEAIAITTENLVYNLKEETLSIGNRSGSSNAVKQDGEVTIHHTGGQLILIESND